VRAFHELSRALAGGLVLLGVLIAVRTWQLGSGGGFGYVLAALFLLAGAGRLFMLRRQ
jgi:hypothetical protein